MVAPFSPGVVLMGKRDFHPLSANFLLAKHLKSHWSNYAKGKAEAGQKADIGDWRVARTIFVADDDKIAARWRDEVLKRAMVRGLASLPKTKPPTTIPRWLKWAAISTAATALSYALYWVVQQLLAASPGP